MGGKSLKDSILKSPTKMFGNSVFTPFSIPFFSNMTEIRQVINHGLLKNKPEIYS